MTEYNKCYDVIPGINDNAYYEWFCIMKDHTLGKILHFELKIGQWLEKIVWLTELINKHPKFDDIVYDDDHYERSFTIKDANRLRIVNYKIRVEWLTQLMNGNMTF